MLRSLIFFLAAVGLSSSSAIPAGPDPLEQRIDRALAFLKSMQEMDGSWNQNVAISSLSIMAFLSAGHVPGEGPYGAAIEKGVRWVLGKQSADGLFAERMDGQEMYHHGIGTLMLAEVAGMTGTELSRKIKPALEKGIKLILTAQRSKGTYRGGWRYQVAGEDADISVTGWQLLALRAAKNLGCDVPAERIAMALDFVQRCREPMSGGFCYMPGGGVTVPCTGTCILALELCGKEHRSREAIQAGGFLLKQPLTWNDGHFFYLVYYSSQAMFQLGNNYWNFYRPQLHKVLFANQQANGSWVGNDGLGANYGTAMSVLALTVEYRLLPIYQRGEASPGLK